MMLLCMNVMAQIDPYDRNWHVVVFDEFDQPNRQFDSTFREPYGLWLAFDPRLHPSGITKWSYDAVHHDTIYNHQIFQHNHCVIDNNYETNGGRGVLKLCSNFISTFPVLCSQPNAYKLPPPYSSKTFQCDWDHKRLHYFSGMIESYPDTTVQVSEYDEKNYRSFPGIFRYGYFEIKCKVPVHRGAATGFWLWDAQKNRYYEAIDIFEHSWLFTDEHFNYPGSPFGSPRVFSCGVHYSPTSHTNASQYGRLFPKIPDNEEDLSGWHTFGCEWLPESVTFYRDGKAYNAVKGREKIPSHPLTLKTTYSIDEYACDTVFWTGTDTMYIDYIKVFQLTWDCETEEVIACQTDLNNFAYGVKKSINITSTIDDVKVADTCRVTFRATDFFEITGPFQTDLGGELTVIMQECPDTAPETTKQPTYKNNTP